jgi:hypothetical protein
MVEFRGEGAVADSSLIHYSNMHGVLSIWISPLGVQEIFLYHQKFAFWHIQTEFLELDQVSMQTDEPHDQMYNGCRHINTYDT